MAECRTPLLKGYGVVAMSRIFKALSQARAIAPAGESFREVTHPWGTDLGGEPIATHADALHTSTETRPAQQSAATPWTKPGPIEPAAESPLAGFGAEVRQQLAGLVERIFLPLSGPPTRCVGFAAVDADGPSGLITAATAELLSERTTASVCVVDGHLAMPSLHRYFGVANRSGLADAMAVGAAPGGSAQRLRANLWIVCAGEKRARVSVSGDAMRQQMAKFIPESDYVLVNMEPVGHCGDACRFAAVMDGVILVVDAESTRRDAGRRAAEILRVAGASVIGAVLTNRRFPIPERVYRRL